VSRPALRKPKNKQRLPLRPDRGGFLLFGRAGLAASALIDDFFDSRSRLLRLCSVEKRFFRLSRVVNLAAAR